MSKVKRRKRNRRRSAEIINTSKEILTSLHSFGVIVMKSSMSGSAFAAALSMRQGKTHVAAQTRLMLSSLVILFGISTLPSFFASSSFNDICEEIDNRLPCSVPTVMSPFYEGTV